MEIIKSKDNPLIKKIVSLRENRRDRVKNGLFVIEGLRFCREAVLSGADIHTVLMTDEFYNSHLADADFICSTCSDVKIVSEAISKKLSDTVNSQGVFCICAIPDENLELYGKKYIALENLQDPGNIGTIIRTAEAFGIDGVIIVGSCADVYSPKVLRSTMGTIFRMPIFRFSDIKIANEQFEKAELNVYGAVLDKNSALLSQTKLKEKSVCLIGNEANGLSSCAKEICSEFLIIDMPGNAESLNAAVAASVIMWEMIKHR